MHYLPLNHPQSLREFVFPRRIPAAAVGACLPTAPESIVYLVLLPFVNNPPCGIFPPHCAINVPVLSSRDRKSVV